MAAGGNEAAWPSPEGEPMLPAFTQEPD